MLGERTEQPPPGRAVVEFVARAVQRSVGDRGGPVRQGVRVGHLGGDQVDTAGGEVELGEERRGHPEGVDGRADVVQDAGIVRVGPAARAAAERRLGLR